MARRPLAFFANLRAQGKEHIHAWYFALGRFPAVVLLV